MIRVSFREALLFLLRGLPIALIVAGTAAALIFFVSRNPEPMYRSTAILLATRPSSGIANVPSLIAPPQVDPAIYRSAVMHGGLLEQALGRFLGGAPTQDELEEWGRRVRVRVDENLISGLVRIEVDAESPDAAAAVANLLSDALLTWDRTRVDRNIQATLSSLDRSIALLGAELRMAEELEDQAALATLQTTRSQLVDELRAAEALNISAVVMGLLEPFREAVPAREPFNDTSAFLTVVGFAALFLLTYVVLLASRLIDPRVRGPEDLAGSAGIPPLATVPSRQRSAQAFQSAVGRVALALPVDARTRGGSEGAAPEGGGVVVLVTSPASAGAQHLLATSLAEAYARATWNTLFVNADLEPRQSRGSAQASRTASMLRMLQDGERAEPATVTLEPGIYLDVLQVAPGTTHAASFGPLAKGLAGFLAAWRERYDVVIVNAPALSESAAALALPESTDCVLLVAVQKETLTAAAQEAVRDLKRAGYPNIETVLFEAPSPPRGGVSPAKHSTTELRGEQPQVAASRARVTATDVRRR